MNILHITTFLHFGAGRVILDTCKAIKDRGDTVFIVATAKVDCFHSQDNLVEEARAYGIPVFLLDDVFTRDFSALNRSAEELARIMEESPPDIVHAHAAIPAFVAYTAGKMAGLKVPVISSFHGWGVDKPASMKAMDIMIFNSLAHIIPVSKGVRDYLVEEGLKNTNCTVVYNGFKFDELAKAMAVTEPGFEFPKDKFILGAIADLSKRKGLNYLLEAVSLLGELKEQIALYIFGDGEERERLTELSSKLGLERTVYFMGYDPKAKYYIRHFDILVLPSLGEGLPVTVVEALASQKAVLAADSRGTNELVEEGINGYLVAPGNAEALAKGIKKAYLNRDKLARMGLNGYRFAQANLDFGLYINKIYDIYNECRGE